MKKMRMLLALLLVIVMAFTRITSYNVCYTKLLRRFMGTWRQMERLVDMGLVKVIGMSSMTIPKLEAVLPLCRIKPAVIRNNFV